MTVHKRLLDTKFQTDSGGKNYTGPLQRRGQEVKQHYVVESRDLLTPPGSPNEGDHYLMPSTGTLTGDWSGFSNNAIAVYSGGAWVQITSAQGDTITVNAENGAWAQYDGSAWREVFSPANDSTKFANSDATPSVKGGTFFQVADTTAPISALDDMRDGQRVVIKPNTTAQTFLHSASLVIPGGQDFVLEPSGAPVEFTKIDGVVTMLGATSGTALDVSNGYFDLAEISTPANPAANNIRVYAKDESGVTKFIVLDSTGVETVLASTGGDNPNQIIAEDNGIAFDGTDQFAAFKALVEAQPSGTEVILSRGTLGLLPTDKINMPVGVGIKGAGRTENGSVINLLGPAVSGVTGGAAAVFRTLGLNSFEALHFKAVTPAVPDSPGSGIFVEIGASGLRVINTSCNLGWVQGVTTTGRMQFFLWERGGAAGTARDTEDFIFHDNVWENTWRTMALFFGTGVGRYSYKNVIITNNIVRECGTSAFILQDPEGGAADQLSQSIIFSNNTMENIGYTTGSEGIGFGAASTAALICSDNTFMGGCRNWISLEQHANRWTISGNSFYLTDTLGGGTTKGVVTLKYNEAGDTGQDPAKGDTPDGIVITNNNMVMLDAGTNFIGILVTNAPPNEALQNSIIGQNSIHGMQYGIATRDVNNTISIAGNLLYDCEQGLRVVHPSLLYRDNVLINCDIGVYINGGWGMLGTHHFNNCTTLFQSSAATPSTISGFTLVKNQNIVSGDNNISIAPIRDYSTNGRYGAGGLLSYHWNGASTNYFAGTAIIRAGTNVGKTRPEMESTYLLANGVLNKFRLGALSLKDGDINNWGTRVVVNNALLSVGSQYSVAWSTPTNDSVEDLEVTLTTTPADGVPVSITAWHDSDQNFLYDVLGPSSFGSVNIKNEPSGIDIISNNLTIVAGSSVTDNGGKIFARFTGHWAF